MIKFNKIINCLQNPKFYKSYFHGVAPLFELSPLVKKISKAKTLIDVGSNKGQFGLLTRKFFPDIKIHSFEPQIEELNIQKKILGSNNINYYNFALGSEEKISNLYITERKDSSSLLKPIETNSKKYLAKEIRKISVKRLDKLPGLNNIERPSILKLDVQGFELEVLKGSNEILNFIDYIITEVSFVEIYENQVMENKLVDFIQSKSFKLEAKCNLSKIREKFFQEDILFIKKIKMQKN